jgi:hypothetical protein
MKNKADSKGNKPAIKTGSKSKRQEKVDQQIQYKEEQSVEEQAYQKEQASQKD